MARPEERLNHGCAHRIDEWHGWLDWRAFIERVDPIMTTMCGRLWRRGNCARERLSDGTWFRGAWWELPSGVYVCVPTWGHFYCYDPASDAAVELCAGWTVTELERVLSEIVERNEVAA